MKSQLYQEYEDCKALDLDKKIVELPDICSIK